MTNEEAALTAIERLSTGNPQADEILGGGFPVNSLNILMGLPGTGKTIFAEQMVFHNASPEGRPILYLTTLSEPMNKVVRYLQQFPFFKEELLGSAVRYEDAGAAIAAEGPAALTTRLQESIDEYDPKIIVVDSFKALHDLITSMPEMRRMLYELTGLLAAYETTVFFIGEYTDDQIATLPEFAIADSIVQFTRTEDTRKDQRYLRVRKLRGSAYKEGHHAFRIGAAGLEVFPRLTSPTLPEGYRILEERVSTGIAGLDRMISGGLRRGSATLIAGPSGAGKTTIALSFAMEGLRQGEEVLYINFQENPSELDFVIRNLGQPLSEVERRRLHLVYRSPVELQIDSVIVTLFTMLEEHSIRRVVIDSVDDLSIAIGDTQRVHDYLYALVQHLSVRGVTLLMVMETGSMMQTDSGRPDNRISYMSSNLILLGLQGEGKTRRTVRVLKSRGAAHDPDVRELDMSAHGITIH